MLARVRIPPSPPISRTFILHTLSFGFAEVITPYNNKSVLTAAKDNLALIKAFPPHPDSRLFTEGLIAFNCFLLHIIILKLNQIEQNLLNDGAYIHTHEKNKVAFAKRAKAELDPLASFIKALQNHVGKTIAA